MPKITKIVDNYVTIEGRVNYIQDEAFRLSEAAIGIVITATEDKASLLIVGDPQTVSLGTDIKEKVDYRTVRVYEHFFGKIINIAGRVLFPENFTHPKDAKPMWTHVINNESPSIFERKKVKQPMETGVLTIDTMIPIGKGQRELIIGDRGTGKTSIALTAIINQKDTKMKSIYVAIGQKRSSIANAYDLLEKHGALKNTIILYANPDSAAEQYIIPKVGMAMAEAMAYKGEHVLIVLDDLTKHANIWREISLSVGKTPGREAYPTDIFYQHSYILEKAGNFTEKFGNGSITCLPIVETVSEDVATLIPSNVISITDGQIFTSASQFNQGTIPAINIPMSVSRTGTSVQSSLIRHVSKGFKAEYTKLNEIQKYMDLATEESSDELVKQIEKFNGFKNMLVQYGYSGYSREMIYVLATLLEMGALVKLKEPKHFGEVFSNFCRRDAAAQKVLTYIKTLQPREKIDEAIKIVFVPLLRTLSGIDGDTYSYDEAMSYRRVK